MAVVADWTVSLQNSCWCHTPDVIVPLDTTYYSHIGAVLCCHSMSSYIYYITVVHVFLHLKNSYATFAIFLSFCQDPSDLRLSFNYVQTPFMISKSKSVIFVIFSFFKVFYYCSITVVYISPPPLSHPSQTYLPPLLPRSPLVLSMCPL